MILNIILVLLYCLISAACYVFLNLGAPTDDPNSRLGSELREDYFIMSFMWPVLLPGLVVLLIITRFHRLLDGLVARIRNFRRNNGSK